MSTLPTDSTIDCSACLTSPLAPVLDWTEQDEKKTFYEDDDVTLVVPYSSQGGQPTLIEWAQGDHPIYGNRFRAVNRDGRTELNIRRIRRDDGGRYSVSASNESGYSTAKFELSVDSQVPDAPTFIRRLHDIAVKVGTRARLLVEVRSPTEIQIHWYRNDRKLEENKTYRPQHEGNFYYIDLSSVSLLDSGRWTCRAENAAGRSHCSCEVSILIPKAYKAPFFTKELEAILTELGTVSLECKVMGIPTPQLIWYKDNKRIKAGDIFALTANPKDPSSLGTYTCEAVNCMGAAFSTSRVIARGHQTSFDEDSPYNSLLPPGPPPTFIKEMENAKAKIGASALLECQVLVPPWPRSIYWYNKEGVVEASDKYHIMADGLGGYSIEINYLEAVDDGEWKCVATSATGVKQFSAAYVHVQMPKNYRKPRFVESLKAVMTEDGLVSFECKVVGFPTPTLQWFKDNEELKPGDVYQLTGTSSLGSYSCVAKNVMGQAESSTQLTIEDIRNHLSEEDKLLLLSNNKAPKFIEGLKSSQATVNEEFKFTVQVSISPEPKVSWYRDDQQVVESDNVKMLKETLGLCHLKIHKLEMTDQAEWKCIATNDFGQSITTCFLKLNVPKHYKKPKFLEELKAVLSEGGAVNLECKVIGVPQPTLKWFKDGRELKAGDIHKIISGEDGTCCLGMYTCEAHNCMGTTTSSAALLGFEDKSQIEKIDEGKKSMIVKDPSLSTIQEEGTSEIYDTPMASIEEREISFSFDGKEVSVSLYETPDLTEEEAIKVVEMYADELSEHISEKNMIELPPLRFTKESSRSQNIQMEAVVIDVPHKGSIEDDDLRTDAGLDDISEDVMSPKTTFESFDTPVDDIPFDVINSEFLEKTLSGYLDENKSETLAEMLPPVKPPRKKDTTDRSKSKSSDKSSKSDPNEQFLDALSEDPTQVTNKTSKTSFETAKDNSTQKDDRSKEKEEPSPNKDSKSSSKKNTKKAATVEPKVVDQNTRDDDSLQEFERQKLTNVITEKEIIEHKVESTNAGSKTKRSKKGSESSEKEDDSLIEYEKRKSIIVQTSTEKKKKSPEKSSVDSKGSRKNSADIMSNSSSSEGSEKRVGKNKSEENTKQKGNKPKRKLKSTESHSESRKAMSSPETGISEYNASDDLEESDMKTSAAEQQASLPTDMSIETEGDSAIEKTEMTVFDSLKHSLREIESNLGEVEKQITSNENQQSSKEIMHTLIQPLKEIEKGLEFIEREVDIEAIRQYPETETRIGSNILEALSQPIQEFELNLSKIDNESNQSLVMAFAPALQELHREMALLQQQQACFESTEDIVSVANSFSPKLLEVEGGVEQSVSTIKEEVSELSDITIPNFEKAQTYEVQVKVIEPLAISIPKVLEDDTFSKESMPSSSITNVTNINENEKECNEETLIEIRSKNMNNNKESDNGKPRKIQSDEKSVSSEASESIKSSKSATTVDITLQKLIKYANRINTSLSRIQEYLHEARTDEEKQTLQDLITFIQPLKDLQSITLNSVSEIMTNEQLNAFENEEVVSKLLTLVEKPTEMLDLTVGSIQSICDELNNPCMYGQLKNMLKKLNKNKNEVQTMVKLIENLSPFTKLEKLSKPVENFIIIFKNIEYYNENVLQDGVDILKNIDRTSETIANCLNTMEKCVDDEKSYKKRKKILSLLNLQKPIMDLNNEIKTIEDTIITTDSVNRIDKNIAVIAGNEVYQIIQNVSTPLQMLRMESSVTQHHIELDEYGSISEKEDNFSLVNLIDSLKSIQNSVSLFHDTIVCKAPKDEKDITTNDLLLALKIITNPLNELCTKLIQTEDLVLKNATVISDPNLGIRMVTKSVNELASLLERSESGNQITNLMGILKEPLNIVEDKLILINEQVHDHDKHILNMNMLRLLSEPFNELQKKLIFLEKEVAKVDSKSFQAHINDVLHPIQELKRTLLVIQDQVSFEYGTEPASIEYNIITLQSLVQPLLKLKQSFLTIQDIQDNTDTTNEREDSKFRSQEKPSIEDIKTTDHSKETTYEKSVVCPDNVCQRAMPDDDMSCKNFMEINVNAEVLNKHVSIVKRMKTKLKSIRKNFLTDKATLAALDTLKHHLCQFEDNLSESEFLKNIYDLNQSLKSLNTFIDLKNQGCFGILRPEIDDVINYYEIFVSKKSNLLEADLQESINLLNNLYIKFDVFDDKLTNEKQNLTGDDSCQLSEAIVSKLRETLQVMDSIKNDDNEIILKVNLVKSLTPPLERLQITFEEKLENKNMDEINTIMNDSFQEFKNALLQIIDRREFKYESELIPMISNVKQITESIQQTNDIDENKAVLSKIRVMLDDKENEYSLSQVSVSENSMYIIDKISKSLNDLDKENSKIQRIIEKQVREEEKLVNIENLIEPSNELIKSINQINHTEGDLLKTLIEPIETVKEAICEIRNQSNDNQGYIDINDTKNKHIMKNITRSISDLKTVLEIMQSQIESSEDMAGTLEDMTNLEALANHLQELKDKLVIVMKDTPLLELSKYPQNDITRKVFEIILKPVEDLNQGLMKIENYALEPVVNEWTAREVLKGITKPIEDLLIGISTIKHSFPMSELIKIPTLDLIEKMIKPLECVEKGIAALTIKEFPDDRFSDEDSYMSEGTTLASISEITNEEASMGYDTVLEPTLQKKPITSVSDSSTEHCVYSPKELQKVLREKTLSPQNSKSEEEEITKKEDLSIREQKSKIGTAFMEENTSLKSITSLIFDKPTNDNKDDSESDTILLKSPKDDYTTIKHIDLETTSQNLQVGEVKVLSHKAELINSLVKQESIIHKILEVSEPQKPITKDIKTHLSQKLEIIKEILVTERKINENLNSESESILDNSSQEFKSAQALSAQEKQILMDEIKVIENLCNKKEIQIENVKHADTQFAESKEVINLQKKAQVIECVLNTDTTESDINRKLDDKMSQSEQLLSITESPLFVQTFKLNESQAQFLSQKAELIDSLVKKEYVINEILKISKALKPIPIELKSHLAQKAEIIEHLLNTEEVLEQKLHSNAEENDALLEFQSAQALSLEDKEKLKNEIKVIENLCEKKGMKIENLQAAESGFEQTHEIEDLVKKAMVIEGVLNKHMELVGEDGLKSIALKTPENIVNNKNTLIETSVDKTQTLNISQEQALAHKAELIDSLVKKESILNEMIQVSEAQKPLTTELKSHLTEKAEIIKEIFKAEERVDKEIIKTSEQNQNKELEQLKAAQALTPADKEKLLNEVQVIENICNKTGIKIEVLQQAEAQFAKSHEVESLLEKAEVIEKMLQKENIENNKHTLIETHVVVDKPHKLNVTQEQALAHKRRK
uniref:Muscle M-line assembly protein unc-89 n=1 Tax=Cacopsylla melanoneura TaxID=428564 RepID=A0A8D8WCF3_9HEMI